jgi:hypothetical protein
MNNLKTYDELNEELFFKKKKKEDDVFGQKLLDFIVNHCDDIDLKKQGRYYTFILRADNRNENDPLGEEDYDTDVKIVYWDSDSTFHDTLEIDGDEIDLSRDMRHKILKALKNLDQLKKNKIKRGKMEKTENLLKKFD